MGQVEEMRGSSLRIYDSDRTGPSCTGTFDLDGKTTDRETMGSAYG
jgi:hypothetical protein